MTRIYTKTGDTGLTSLFNGKRVSKSSELIDLIGLLDLLNSQIGLLASLSDKKSKVILTSIQSVIFEIGSEVAYPEKHGNLNLKNITKKLEEQINLMELKNKPLKNFILPGGSIFSSNIHICRAITRSVERTFIKQSKYYKNESVNVFLNRLSDFFFVLARFANLNKDIKDIVWKKSSTNF